MPFRIFSFYLTAYRGGSGKVGEKDSRNLELLECLLVALRLGHLLRVELHRLRESLALARPSPRVKLDHLGHRPALAHRHHVADLKRL